MTAEIRLGLPLVGGALPQAARDLGAPILVSANAFVKRNRAGQMVGFRSNVPDLLGLDLAIDSAGFTAWSTYGRYPWTPAAYVLGLVAKLYAAGHHIAWWASMDACCEPEIAGSHIAVRMRQAETTRVLAECVELAEHAGIPEPLPVVQGWHVDDYVRHARDLEPYLLGPAPLLGVGSMCRRHVRGRDGLIQVVEALDLVLPPAVRLHLFGVKSDGLAALARHHRVASVDSMAWDVEARRRWPKGRTMARRAGVMADWHATQLAKVASAAPTQRELPELGVEPPEHPTTGEWAELLASDECGYGEAMFFAAWEDAWGLTEAHYEDDDEPAVEGAPCPA